LLPLFPLPVPDADEAALHLKKVCESSNTSICHYLYAAVVQALLLWKFTNAPVFFFTTFFKHEVEMKVFLINNPQLVTNWLW